MDKGDKKQKERRKTRLHPSNTLTELSADELMAIINDNDTTVATLQNSVITEQQKVKTLQMKNNTAIENYNKLLTERDEAIANIATMHGEIDVLNRENDNVKDNENDNDKENVKTVVATLQKRIEIS